MVKRSLKKGGGKCRGIRSFLACKDKSQGFLLANLEKLMKECPGGSHILMKISPIFAGDIPLMAIRYKYISQKVLGFITN